MRAEPPPRDRMFVGASVPIPTRLFAASINSVFESKLRLLGIDIAVLLIVRVSVLASPSVTLPVAPKVVKLPAAGVVPPIAGGDDKFSVPPSVRLPDEVTVPERVRPLTVPVPETLVTVPVVELVPAPIAVLKSVALSADTVLSALKRGKVIALGFAKVNRLPPTVVAPSVVRAVPAASSSISDRPKLVRVVVVNVSAAVA